MVEIIGGYYKQAVEVYEKTPFSLSWSLNYTYFMEILQKLCTYFVEIL